MEPANTSLLRISTKQIILLVVLGCVLGGVIWSSLGTNETAETDAGVQSGSTRRTRAAAVTAASEEHSAWPAVSLADMLKHNPFGPLASVQAAESTLAPESPDVVVDITPPEPQAPETPVAEMNPLVEKAAAIAAFRELKVSLILCGRDRKSAMIGDRLIHENDIVNGVRIVSIRPDGLVVRWDGAATLTTDPPVPSSD